MIACALIAINVANGYAQVDSLVEKYKTNLAVPDAPAFKLLDAEPGSIMRPASTRDLAVSVSNFFLSGKQLPASFAAEFSPYLLVGGKELTLRSYQQSALNRALMRSRVSIASQRSAATGNTTKLSVGLRFTLRDDADMRINTEYINRVFAFLDNDVKRADNIRTLMYGSLNPENVPDSLRKAANAEIQKQSRMQEESLRTEREQVKKNAWKSTVIECGMALAGSSADSVGTQGIVVSAIGLWIVGSGAIETWGQWVAGFSPRLTRDSSGVLKDFSGPLAARAYIGQNEYKAFAECNADWLRSTAKSYSVLIGGETRVYEHVWLEASAGVKKIGTQSWIPVSTFNIRFDQ